MVAPEPGAVTMCEGENATVKPVGNPLAVRVTAALKVEFAVVVKVTALEDPAGTLMEVAEGARVKVGEGAIVTERDTWCVVEPLAAETVAE